MFLVIASLFWNAGALLEQARNSSLLSHSRDHIMLITNCQQQSTQNHKFWAQLTIHSKINHPRNLQQEAGACFPSKNGWLIMGDGIWHHSNSHRPCGWIISYNFATVDCPSKVLFQYQSLNWLIQTNVNIETIQLLFQCQPWPIINNTCLSTIVKHHY